MLIYYIDNNEFYVGNRFSYDISINLFLSPKILFDVSVKIKTPKSIHYDTLFQVFHKIDDKNISLDNIISKGDEREFMLTFRKSKLINNHIDLNMVEYTGLYSINYSKTKANAPFSKGEYIKHTEIENNFISNNFLYLFMYYDVPQNNIFNTNNVHIFLINLKSLEEFKNNYVNYYQNKSIYSLHSKILVKDIKDIPIIDVRRLENYIYDFELFTFVHYTLRYEIYKILNKKYILYYFQDGIYHIKFI